MKFHTLLHKKERRTRQHNIYGLSFIPWQLCVKISESGNRHSCNICHNNNKKPAAETPTTRTACFCLRVITRQDSHVISYFSLIAWGIQGPKQVFQVCKSVQKGTSGFGKVDRTDFAPIFLTFFFTHVSFFFCI